MSSADRDAPDEVEAIRAALSFARANYATWESFKVDDVSALLAALPQPDHCPKCGEPHLHLETCPYYAEPGRPDAPRGDERELARARDRLIGFVDGMVDDYGEAQRVVADFERLVRAGRPAPMPSPAAIRAAVACLREGDSAPTMDMLRAAYAIDFPAAALAALPPTEGR